MITKRPHEDIYNFKFYFSTTRERDNGSGHTPFDCAAIFLVHISLNDSFVPSLGHGLRLSESEGALIRGNLKFKSLTTTFFFWVVLEIMG